MSTETALEEKHALVTGGGHGIGGAIAKILSSNGAKLTLVGRNLSKLNKLRDELLNKPNIKQVEIYQLDVTDETAVIDVFADAATNLGTIDILINNSGIAETATYQKTSSDMLRRILEVNVIGTHICTQQVLKSMKENNWGRIINISSLAGLTGQPYISAYCASKHAVLGLTRALALELVKTGITVNAVCPAYVDTGMVDRGVENIVKVTGMSQEDATNELAKTNPQNRIIGTEEVAATVGWLCLPGSESITGQSIAMAGGAWM